MSALPDDYESKMAALGIDRGKLASGFAEKEEEDEAPNIVPLNPERQPAPVKKVIVKPKPKVKKTMSVKPTPSPPPKQVKFDPPIPEIESLTEPLTDDQVLKLAYALGTSQSEGFTEDQLKLVIMELTLNGQVGLALLNGIFRNMFWVWVEDRHVWFRTVEQPIDRNSLVPGMTLRFTPFGCTFYKKMPSERVVFARWSDDRRELWLKVKDKHGWFQTNKYQADYIDFLCPVRPPDPETMEDWSI